MKRVLLAGLLGGLALFVWEAVAHLVLPLGQAGLKPLDNEQTVVASLRDNVKQPGLYYFPAPAANGAEQAPTGPTGFMAFQPNGALTMMPSQLLTQLGADVVVMVLAGILLLQAGGIPGFGKRVAFFTVMGILPALRADLSYWNWYAFTVSYTAAQFIVNIVGFCVAGMVLARLVGTPSAVPRHVSRAAA
jgi:hypothetical protein